MTNTPESKLAEALRMWIDHYGAIHDEGCPEDDTCDCGGRKYNDAANAALNAYDASLKQGAVVETVARLEHGILLIGYGECELCDAHQCFSPQDIRAAVNHMVFGGDADAANEEELQGICDWIADEENWSHDGVMQPFQFEIGGLDGYRLNGRIATTPPTPPAPHATTDTMDAAQGKDQVVWLIERGSPAEYLETILDVTKWTSDPHAATGFSSRKEAKEFAEENISGYRICDHLFYGGFNGVMFYPIKQQENHPIPAEQQAASEGRRVVPNFVYLHEAIRLLRQHGHDNTADRMKTLLEELKSLPAGDDGMRRDAERYRFIRHNYDVSAARRGYHELIPIRPPDRELPSTAEVMDKHIDAAIAAQTAGGGK